jgi:hypothetical protein
MQKLNKPIANQQNMAVNTRTYKGTQQTIKYMSALSNEGQVSPKIRQYAEQVIREVQPKDYMSEIAALYYDTCRTIRYTRDPIGAEYLQHPEVILQNKAADCDDIALYLNTLLKSALMSVGNETSFTTVSFDGGEHTHVFLTVVEERSGKRLILDPVAGPKSTKMANQVKGFTHYKA